MQILLTGGSTKVGVIDSVLFCCHTLHKITVTATTMDVSRLHITRNICAETVRMKILPKGICPWGNGTCQFREVVSEIFEIFSAREKQQNAATRWDSEIDGPAEFMPSL